MKPLKVPIILGVVLLLIALGVRTGWFARKNPGEPINSVARATSEIPRLSEKDALLVEQRYAIAHVLTSGLRYVLRAQGEGDPPRPGDMVMVNYDGKLLSGGPFDSTYDRGTPMELQVGTGKVLPGLDEALLQMRPGEKRTLIVPWWLGYGERGRPPLVPGRATLVYEIELISIVREPVPTPNGG